MDGKGRWRLNFRVRMLFKWALVVFAAGYSSSVPAQSLVLPPRDAGAPPGDAFVQSIPTMEPAARDAAVEKEFLAGNVPGFLRKLCAVNVTNTTDGITNIGTFFVTPDYLAVGSDTNYFLAPISPGTAQRIADRLDCILPQRVRMVDAIYAAAEAIVPSPIPPSTAR